jgi:hypothetical protein
VHEFDATTQTQSSDLKGTQGMRLVGTVLERIVNISPFTGCLPCAPGTPISLVGLSLSGTATLRDATCRLGSGYYDAGADLHFSGDVVIAPPIADQPVQVSAAVQLSGGEPFEPSVLLIPGLGAQPFTGQGVATLVFQRISGYSSVADHERRLRVLIIELAHPLGIAATGLAAISPRS